MGQLTREHDRSRRLLLVAAGASALTAVLAGLSRLGLALPIGSDYASLHGPMFVLGTFGLVIGLERAVALGARWAFAAPLAAALAAVALLARQLHAGAWLSVVSAIALLAVNGAIVRRQAAAFTWLMAIGSVLLLAGCLAWALGRPVFEVVPAWIVFFALTIVAERLELSRLTPTPRWASRLLLALSALLVAATFGALLGQPPSTRAMGALLASMGLWELRFDLARRTIRHAGLPRYAAIGVLAGAGWLVVGGTLLAGLGLPAAGPHYDAIVHAVLVGFVLSMVMAHAPIILPAVVRIDVPFHRVLYAPLSVLQVGLLARIAGDLAGHAALRVAGGAANAAALALLPIAVLWARRRRR